MRTIRKPVLAILMAVAAGLLLAQGGPATGQIPPPPTLSPRFTFPTFPPPPTMPVFTFPTTTPPPTMPVPTSTPPPTMSPYSLPSFPPFTSRVDIDDEIDRLIERLEEFGDRFDEVIAKLRDLQNEF